jgi:hypothetical protein
MNAKSFAMNGRSTVLLAFAYRKLWDSSDNFPRIKLDGAGQME